MRKLCLFTFAIIALPLAAAQPAPAAMYNYASELTGGLQRAWPGCIDANVSVLDPSLGWQNGNAGFCWARHALAINTPKAKHVSGLRTEWVTPAMNATFLQRGQDRIRWGDEGEMHFAIATALDRLYSIYYKHASPGEKIILRKTHLGKERLQCASLGNVRYFCGDADTGEVRSVPVPGGEMTIVIDATAQQDGVPYVSKATVLYFDKPIAWIDVTGIRKLSSTELTETFAPRGDARPARFDHVARIDGHLDLSKGIILRTRDTAARATLTVGTDGRARNVRVLASSDDSFAVQFAHALAKARYEPSVEHGVAVDSVLSAAVFLPKATPPQNNSVVNSDSYPDMRETHLSSWAHASAEFESGGHNETR